MSSSTTGPDRWPDHPTLLCYPMRWWGKGHTADVVLPLQPDAYQVRQRGGLWTVEVGATGELVYFGAGPVTVQLSPAPF